MHHRERAILDELRDELLKESDRRAELISTTHPHPDQYLQGSANGFGMAADRLASALHRIDTLPEMQP